MSYGNYSRNIADLLRYGPPSPPQPYKTTKSTKNPEISSANKSVQ